MRWEDERWVKLYTRETPEVQALSWQARGLFGLLMKQVDRAGIMKLGKLGLKAVAVAVRAPWAEIEGPLSELLADGCTAFVPERESLMLPNFLEAQSAASSDAARKRASREFARALMGGSSSSNDAARGVLGVTNRDLKESQKVTKSHVESRAVTGGHDQSRGDETREDLTPLASLVPPAGAEPTNTVAVAKEKKQRTSRTKTEVPPSSATSDEVLAWCETWGIPWGHEQLDRMLDWARAQGITRKDWRAQWRNWLASPFAAPQLARQGVFRARDGGSSQGTPDPYAAAARRKRQEADENMAEIHRRLGLVQGGKT